MGLDYKQAGVDKEAGYKQVQLIKDMMKQTYTPQVMTEAGGFSGMVRLDAGEMEDPILVSGTDGVGTKLMIAQALDQHETIGIDLVAMCVNDIICQGAKPLFFLDYIATGKLVPEKMAAIVKGVSEGCLQAGCSLIGGETAEMPGMYGENDYDLAGFAVGVVDRPHMITGQGIQAGDVAIGIASSGVHSNGFSLVRAILKAKGIDYTASWSHGPAGQTIGQALLTPTKIYAKAVADLQNKLTIKGLAHITGGGLFENLPRILPDGLGITLDTEAIPPLAIFDYLQEIGQVNTEEMYHTFNMGVGMVLVIDKADQAIALETLVSGGETAFVLGSIADQAESVILG